MKCFTKIAAAFMATALAVTPVVGSLNINTANAANGFVSYNYECDRWYFDESQMCVDITEPNEIKYLDFDASAHGNEITSNRDIAVPMLSNLIFTMNVTGDNLTEDDIKNVKFFVTANNFRNGAVDYGAEQDYNHNTYYRKRRDGSYDVYFSATAFGRKISYKAQFGKNVTLRRGSIVAKNTGYYMIDVDTPNEDLYIRVPKKSDISDAKYRYWARRLACYANSLSKTTNVEREKIYLSFDDDNIMGTSACWQWICDRTKNPTYYKNCACTFDGALTEGVLNEIRRGDNSIEWVELHEISHAYSRGELFLENYETNDELYTNTRGLTAIQNCNNIVNMDIHLDALCGKYNTIFSSKLTDNSIIIDTMVQRFINVADTENNWFVLEDFFYPTSTYGPNTRDKVYTAFKSYTGLDFKSGSKAENLAIALYALYKRAWNGGSRVNSDRYIEFLNQYFPKEDLVAYIKCCHGFPNDII